MASYSMTCSCGHIMSMEAATRDTAVGMFKSMMTQQMLDEHWTAMHKPTETKPTLEQTHMGIQTMVTAAA